MSYPSPAKDMAPVRMKAEFGRQLSIYVMAAWISWGGLPRGSQEDVRQEVRERVRKMGQDGGYILARSHHIQADTPLANVLAIYELVFWGKP